MSTPMSTQPTIGAIPWTAEWILGFPIAGLLLEIFYIDADRKGLLIVGGLFYAETQNMPGGCILTPHYPFVELLASGLLCTAISRLFRLLHFECDLSRIESIRTGSSLGVLQQSDRTRIGKPEDALYAAVLCVRLLVRRSGFLFPCEKQAKEYERLDDATAELQRLVLCRARAKAVFDKCDRT